MLCHSICMQPQRRAALIIHVKENKENLHKSSRLHTWAELPTFLMLLKEKGGKKNKKQQLLLSISCNHVFSFFFFFIWGSELFFLHDFMQRTAALSQAA